jgi:hypothetical protein
LTGCLAEEESVLSRLEITRETMTEILSGDEMVAEPGSEAGPQAGGPAEASGAGEEENRFGRQSVRVEELVLVLHVRPSYYSLTSRDADHIRSKTHAAEPGPSRCA